ncbi:MAG: SIS domain-containing protein [Nocardioidaceae bacterium]
MITDSHLAREVAAQPADWAEAARVAPNYADRLPGAGERVAIIGCGTSLYMARAYSTLREASGQGVTDAWPASEARLGRGYDRVLAISRSGTTTEVLQALAGYQQASPVTVVTASEGTAILAHGQPICLPQFDEQSVVQTRFATSVLALLRTALGADLTPVISQAAAALSEPDRAYDAVRSAEEISFVGMGLGAALAEEAALKLREATRSWAEAYWATEYRHGPISISGPGRAVWALGDLPANFERDVGVTGAHLEHRGTDPMAELVRVHRLCLLRAGDRDIDPDEPRNLQRSVILEP